MAISNIYPVRIVICFIQKIVLTESKINNKIILSSITNSNTEHGINKDLNYEKHI